MASAHAVVLAGCHDRAGVVLAAVVDGHPDPEGQGTLPLVEVTVADGLVVSAGTPKPGFSRSKARSARASWALLLAADGSP